MRALKRTICLLWVVAVYAGVLNAQSLRVTLDGNQLRLTAPDFHFLTAEALRQLHNGAPVNYVFSARILASKSGDVLAESGYRFAVSYDLWEEKYAVTRLQPNPRSVSHLTSSGAESWCMDSFALPIDKLGADQPFWIAVEYRILETQTSQSDQEDSRYTLAGLIDVFSRDRKSVV